jgi:hypothetical protein
MVYPTGQSDAGNSSTGFISRGSLVQVQSPLLPCQICHTAAEVYHGWPEVSCSQLKALRESPLAFYWRFIARSAPPHKSDALAYGSLLHTWAELGADAFWPNVVVAPDTLVTATGALSKRADEWLKGLDSQSIPVSPADFDKLRAQTNALLRNPEVARIIEARTDAEFNIRTAWHGHPIRCRVDGATADFFYDWKTTRDLSPMRDWWRSVLQFGYHLQSAMYQHCAVQAGWPEHRMRFIVTSTVWPYECCVVVLPERLIEKGRRECVRLLDELRNRLDWDVWTRLDSHEVCELPCPEFAMRGE